MYKKKPTNQEKYLILQWLAIIAYAICSYFWSYVEDEIEHRKSSLANHSKHLIPTISLTLVHYLQFTIHKTHETHLKNNMYSVDEVEKAS